MHNVWSKIRLGDVFAVSKKKLGAHEFEPPVFAISKHDGVIPSSDYHDRRVASAKLDGYKILPDEGWAYSTIHIDEGSIARNSQGLTGVVSPMYTILNWTSSENDPSYFELLLRTPQMLARYGDMAQGSLERRRSLPWKLFSSIEVDVPTLEAQHRIVDLMASIDTVVNLIGTTTKSSDSYASALRRLRADVLESLLSGEHEIPEAYDAFLTPASQLEPAA